MSYLDDQLNAVGFWIFGGGGWCVFVLGFFYHKLKGKYLKREKIPQLVYVVFKQMHNTSLSIT